MIQLRISEEAEEKRRKADMYVSFATSFCYFVLLQHHTQVLML